MTGRANMCCYQKASGWSSPLRRSSKATIVWSSEVNTLWQAPALQVGARASQQQAQGKPSRSNFRGTKGNSSMHWRWSHQDGVRRAHTQVHEASTWGTGRGVPSLRGVCPPGMAGIFLCFRPVASGLERGAWERGVRRHREGQVRSHQCGTVIKDFKQLAHSSLD